MKVIVLGKFSNVGGSNASIPKVRGWFEKDVVECCYELFLF
jgi:hypothetical protein